MVSLLCLSVYVDMSDLVSHMGNEVPLDELYNTFLCDVWFPVIAQRTVHEESLLYTHHPLEFLSSLSANSSSSSSDTKAERNLI